MVIIETSVFTRQVRELLSDEEYRQMQLALILQPGIGSLIPGSGGLRKMRWTLNDRGKRGGVRVIYFWAVSFEQVLLLFIHAKNEIDNLTPDQIKVLRKIIDEEYP